MIVADFRVAIKAETSKNISLFIDTSVFKV